MVTIKIQAPDAASANQLIADLPVTAAVYMAAAMPDIGDFVVQVWGQIPEQPDRMRAVDRHGGNMEYFNRYVRRIGLFPLSSFGIEIGSRKWGREFNLGSMAGEAGSVEYISEDSQSRWEVGQPVFSNNGADVSIGVANLASYAPEVFGPHGVQLPYHEETGWTSSDDVLEMVASYAEQQAVDAITQAIADVVGG